MKAQSAPLVLTSWLTHGAQGADSRSCRRSYIDASNAISFSKLLQTGASRGLKNAGRDGWLHLLGERETGPPGLWFACARAHGVADSEGAGAMKIVHRIGLRATVAQRCETLALAFESDQTFLRRTAEALSQVAQQFPVRTEGS